MSTIHPSAVVDPAAEIAPDAVIGPLCVVGPRARIGPGTRLISQVTVLGRTTVGAYNTLWPHVVLGGNPQDLKFQGEETELIIGDENEIREGVTIHLGTRNGGGVTRVGSHNLLMVGAHVAHDCQVGSHIVMANAVQLAGHIVVQDHAVIAGASGVHHYVTIGQYAMVGGMTRVVHDVPPFMITEGNPAKVRGVNKTLLTRHRFPEQTIENLRESYKLLFRGGNGEGEAAGVRTISDTLLALEEQFGDDECVAILVNFVRNTSIGLHGRHRESTRPDNPRHNPAR